MQTLKRRPAVQRSRRRRNRPKISKRRLVLAAVAAFLLISAGRSVLPALGIVAPGLPSLGGDDTATPEPQLKTPPAPTIDLNGVLEQGGGAPMISQIGGQERIGGAGTFS